MEVYVRFSLVAPTVPSLCHFARFLHSHAPFLCICQRPHPADYQEMVQFHSEDYVKFLSRVTPDNMPTLIPQLQKCAIASLPPVSKRWLCSRARVLILTEKPFPHSFFIHRAFPHSQSAWVNTRIAPYSTASTTTANSTRAARSVRHHLSPPIFRHSSPLF